jgi:Coenzyme PQQ synthesis protein D (PqqD)
VLTVRQQRVASHVGRLTLHVDSRARPRPRPGYALEELDGELVVYHPATEAIFFCNATAALIFRMCDGARDVAQISAELAAHYPDAAQRIAADVESTLSRLIEHGALEWS